MGVQVPFKAKAKYHHTAYIHINYYWKKCNYSINLTYKFHAL